MLSYQHAFHAGNHADIIKHITLCALLRAMSRKDKPFLYLDTHAGNGCYDIHSQSKQDDVVARQLLASNKASGAVQDYISLIKPYLDKGNYPGSPLVAWDMLGLLRQEKDTLQDSFEPKNLQLSELHPSAFEDLKHWTNHTSFHCHHRDGMELLNAITPPKPNRGLVLIDPAYEQADEYNLLITTMAKALNKWQNGIYCIWYPLLSQQRMDRESGSIVDTPKHGLSERMLQEFTSIALQHNVGLLDIQFAYAAPSETVGMYGSGLVIFNPPWQLDSTLRSALECLQSIFQESPNNLSGVSVLVPSP